VAALEQSSRARSSVLTSLANWAQLPGDETLLRPFSETDPSALAAAGLTKEWRQQLASGQSTLTADLGAPLDVSTWVSSGALDRAGANLLPPSTSQIVLPLSDLVPKAASLTPDSTFRLMVGRRSFLAMNSDSGLESLLGNANSDPALTAHWILAELAQIYFESPNDPTPRGVVLVIPPTWSGSPSLVSAVANGLAGSPVARDVDLTTFFGQVGSQGSRRLLRAQQGLPSLPSTELTRSVGAVDAYSRAVIGDPVALSNLRRLLELAESVLISTQQRHSLLAGLEQRLTRMLAQVTLGNDRTITLTSRSANIPLTIVSTASWPLRLRLDLSSPKLEFPGGGELRTILVQPGRSNEYSFRVDALTSGDLPLKVELQSPGGELVFFTRKITITSTAVSAVALVLTAGAGGYLLIWWGLTLRRSRRARNQRLVKDPE
jgi:hypothetical protein